MINFATNGNPITSDFCPDFGRWKLDLCRSCKIHPQEYFFGKETGFIGQSGGAMEANGVGCNGSEQDGSQTNSGVLSHLDLCGLRIDQH